MRTVALIVATLVALVTAAAAALGQVTNSAEEWLVSVGNESSLLNQELTGDDDQDDAIAPSRRRRDVCGQTYTFSKSQQRDAVRLHNKLRGREGASNMMALKWSDELARRAHDWASQCQWRHDLLTDCQGNKIGQNLFLARGSKSYPKVTITNVIENGWWSEKKFAALDRQGCKGSSMCGHYLQVVWAQFTEFGCTVVKCPFVAKSKTMTGDWKNAIMVACDYGPGRMTRRKKAYLKGAACSQCDQVATQGYYCRKKLCYECDPAKRRQCKCIPKTCVRGTFNSAQCKCICPKGFGGIDCSKSCVCKDKYTWCHMKKQSCFVTSEFQWLRVYCPATCINTCDRPKHGCT